ncbi:Transcription factor spt8 [Recurvomyces mirabilis]|uniref:Transcription factor spt8 n=1 Tax=Recurvomyces mirabilis TaxID=574656 RepID=UPI002DE08A0F|nr:Transcription factor spt8 [Recurvomyces mirabilis]
MADFDDADPTAEDEFENEDEEMEDADADGDQDGDQDDDAQGDEDDEDDQEGDEDDNGDDDEDEDQPDSPSQRPSQSLPARRLPGPTQPSLTRTSPSPRNSAARSPGAGIVASWHPSPRPESLTAQAYDIVPTMAAPQSTSINAVAATPDMKWVFSGGTDGYVRMYNWIDTANGKVPLTVAQKHPFVDSVMKAGSLLTYWENEDATLRTPTRGEGGEEKWTSPVYSLAAQHQALWLLSGTENGGINLQTCRHQAGTRISTLKEHTSAVSVLRLSQDETQLLSGSWDKNIHDWDMQTDSMIRSTNGTFSSNNSEKPLPNGIFGNGFDIGGGDEDAAGSPDGSLFGENDHGSLFGEDNTNGGSAGNAFGEDDDLSRALANGLQDTDQDAPGEVDTEMAGMGDGGPVQPLDSTVPGTDADFTIDVDSTNNLSNGTQADEIDTDALFAADSADTTTAPLTNGLPHTDEPLTAPPTNESSLHHPTSTTTSSTAAADLPAQSESTFLSTSIDGTIRLWDRRLPNPIAVLRPFDSTPPWCTGATWSPDGNTFFAGRRNNSVDEYSMHKLSSTSSAPTRQFRFQAGSGPVYSVRAMPNSRHLVCASQDILRIYDLKHDEIEGRARSAVPFTIVPGHRGGTISEIFVDSGCRFMLSAAGNRGWEGFGTEVLLGYEIGVQDGEGVWHK